jgi:signal transduction histidine kinase
MAVVGRMREHLTRHRLAVALPALVVVLCFGGHEARHSVLSTVAGLGWLGAGACLLLCWRVTGTAATRQVGLGLLVLGMAVPVRFIAAAMLGDRWAAGPTVAALGVGLAAAAVTLPATVAPGSRVPARVGAVLAPAFCVAAVASAVSAPGVRTAGVLAAVALTAGLWVANATCAGRALRAGTSRLASARTVTAIAATGAAVTALQGVELLAPGAIPSLPLLVDLVVLGAAAVAASTAVRRVADALAGQERYGNALLEQFASLEGQVQQARACLHDARAAAAGVRACTSATRQLPLGDPLRAELESSVQDELVRIERMLRLPERRPTVRTTDLDALVRPLVVSHRERGLRVEWSPLGRGPVTIDGDALVVVLGNLLGNALVHAPGALCRVEVAVTDVLTVTVSDDGPGVDEGTRTRMYEAGVGRPGTPGEGLGLAISRDLARRHGGDLDAGPVRTGASFVLTLPLYPAPLPAPGMRRVTRAASRMTLPRPRSGDRPVPEAPSGVAA